MLERYVQPVTEVEKENKELKELNSSLCEEPEELKGKCRSLEGLEKENEELKELNSSLFEQVEEWKEKIPERGGRKGKII